jgi:hypothetical protein
MRIGPWQRRHARTSIAKTRFISSAHASRFALAASRAARARAEHAVVADEMEARRRDERGEFLDELRRGE